LVAAAAYKIPVTLLFNKEDVLTDATALQKKQWMELYAKIGYDCKSISAKYGTNLEEIKAMMQDKVSLFSGHSGVGKSTLINALEPGLDLKTAALSEQHRQGQHTTTFAEMHALRFGGYIIDTPGIKGFGMVDFKSAEIAGFFPEFFLKSSSCKFHNCLHVDEPNCAVKQALEDKTIAASRYASYLQMLEEEASPYRQDSSTHFL
jgi:ribosome biogenesis GTPase